MSRFFQSVLFTFLFIIPVISISQNTDFIMDERDGNVYLIAKFNHTWWMCQNMKYDMGEGSDCYDQDETNCMLKGRLYDQATAKKECPEGYHLPSDNDWKELESYIGMSEDDLDKTHMRLSGDVGKYLRTGGGIGFDADLAGMINPRGSSSQSGEKAFFWTATQEDNYGWSRIISKQNDGVDRKAIDSRHKLSVRCIKYGVVEAGSEKKEESEEK